MTAPLPSTLADALRDAAPERVLIIDGDIRLDAETLRERATVLARTLLSRFPGGGVVSLMLPNWHEAAVVYLGATLAGMGRGRETGQSAENLLAWFGASDSWNVFRYMVRPGSSGTIRQDRSTEPLF